ncbi:MAG: hypothetical protein RIC88_17390 [Ekhidna sp.]
MFDYSESNTFVSTFSNVTLVYLSLIAYYELLKKPSVNLSKHPIFWIVTSLFIYNSVLLLISIFDNYLVFGLNIKAESYAAVSIINLSANIAKNFILFYALVLIDKGYPNTLKPVKA